MEINSQMVLTPKQLKSLLLKTIPAKLPVLITGAPGIGKSDIISQVAQDLGADLLFSHPVVDSPIDYKGMPAIVGENKDQAEFLPFGNLLKIINATKLTIFFLDDLGQAPPAVQAAVMQLLLARRINGHKVSDHVVFLAATNRKQDKAGVSGILEPIKSRFHTIVELIPDLDGWTHWALQSGVSSETIAFLQFRPELLSQFKPSSDMTQSPSPRTWVHAGELTALGIPSDIELEVYSGAVGQAAAIEYVSFLQIYRELPQPKAVLLAPDSAPVPDKVAARYAITMALAGLATSTNLDGVLTYLERLPEEFQVLGMTSVYRRDPDATQCRAFNAWAAKHADVLM